MVALDVGLVRTTKFLSGQYGLARSRVNEHGVLSDGLVLYQHLIIRKIVSGYFAHYEWPMEFQIKHLLGGLSSLARKLPFRRFSGLISREFRMGFLVQRK